MENLCLIERCYCKHHNGEPDENEIICDKGTLTSQRLTRCNFDEWCTGMSNSDEAKYGYKKEALCRKGKIRKIIVIYFLIYKKNLN